jgi:hypothetical protein
VKHGRDSIDRHLVFDLEEVKALECFLIDTQMPPTKMSAMGSGSN